MATNAMTRWPYLVSFVLFVALFASLAYWAMQLFKPPARQVAAPPAAQASAPKVDAAASLFGGRGGKSSTAGSYQLKGLVLASSLDDSVVILSSEGKPARAYRANSEIAPGVTVTEVHPGYIVLSENGVTRRVDLPTEFSSSGGRTEAPVRTSAAPSRTPAPPPRTMPSVPTAPRPSAGVAAGSAGQPNAQQAQSQASQAATGAQPAGQDMNAPAQQPIVVNSPPNMSDPGGAAAAAQQAQQQQLQQQQQQAAGQAGPPADMAPGQAGMTPQPPDPAGTAQPVQPGVPQPVPGQ